MRNWYQRTMIKIPPMTAALTSKLEVLSLSLPDGTVVEVYRIASTVDPNQPPNILMPEPVFKKVFGLGD